jgi:predicted ATPase
VEIMTPNGQQASLGPAVARGLRTLHVEGFRSFKALDVELGRVTVLIGANGSGKSNLLSLLKMVPLLRTQSLRRFVGEAGGAASLLHYGPKVTKEISLRLEFVEGGKANAYEARLGFAAGDSLIFLDETVEFRAKLGKDFTVHSLGAGHAESRLGDDIADKGARVTAKTLNWWLGGMTFFHFHDTSPESPLRRNARQEDTRFLRSDGSNLAAFLRVLAQSAGNGQGAAWARIMGLVRQIAPFIKQLQPTLVDEGYPETSPVRLNWIDERDQLFGPQHLSDGTLRAIALIAALAQPVERLPAFVSIDEPELGLHPAALAVLASLVRSVSARCQVLLATQSPALLDLFEPSEVMVAERAGGESQLKRLDVAGLREWLEDSTLSQLYDKNLLGGRP